MVTMSLTAPAPFESLADALVAYGQNNVVVHEANSTL